MKLFQKIYTLVGMASLLSSGITLLGFSSLEQLICGRSSVLPDAKNDNGDAPPSKRNKLLYDGQLVSHFSFESKILGSDDREVLKCLYKVPIFREAKDLFADMKSKLHNFDFLVKNVFPEVYCDALDFAEQLVEKKSILEKMLAKLKKQRHNFPKKKIKIKVNERLQLEMVGLILSIDKSVKELSASTERKSLNEVDTFVTAIAKDWESQKLYSSVAVYDHDRICRLIKEQRSKLENRSYILEKMKNTESRRSSQSLINKIHVCLDRLSENCSGDRDKRKFFGTLDSCQVPNFDEENN